MTVLIKVLFQKLGARIFAAEEGATEIDASMRAEILNQLYETYQS